MDIIINSFTLFTLKFYKWSFFCHIFIFIYFKIKKLNSKPRARLELATFPLPWECSTTELSRHLYFLFARSYSVNASRSPLPSFSLYENSLLGETMFHLRPSLTTFARWAGRDSNPRRTKPCGLQPHIVDRLSTCPNITS